jgi:hypothetical protein
MSELKGILQVFPWLIGGLFTAAFAISYFALVDVAETAGVSGLFIYVWPFLLDLFMIAASIYGIHKEISHESTWLAHTLVFALMLLSTGFNVTRANPDTISRLVFALPPVFCFIIFEMMMDILGSKSRTLDNPVDSTVAAHIKEEMISEKKFKPVVSENNSEMKRNIRQEVSEMKRNIRQEVSEYYRKNPEANYADAGRALNIPRQNVRLQVLKLKELGLFPENVPDPISCT